MQHTLHLWDHIVQIVDSRLLYVRDIDDNIVRIDVWTHVDGSGNIIVEYERTITSHGEA